MGNLKLYVVPVSGCDASKPNVSLFENFLEIANFEQTAEAAFSALRLNKLKAYQNNVSMYLNVAKHFSLAPQTQCFHECTESQKLLKVSINI